MHKSLALLSTFFLVAACGGGGGGGGSDDPVAASALGFISDDEKAIAGVEFSAAATPFLSLDGGVIEQVTRAVTIELSDDGNSLIISVDGERAVLARDADGDFSGNIGDLLGFAGIVPGFEEVPVGIAVVSSGGDSFVATIGTFPFGAETPAPVIAAATGSTTYFGGAIISAAQIIDGDPQLTQLQGEVTLTATFDSTDEVSGLISLDFSAEDPELQFPAVDLVIEPGAISGNAFSGQITLDDGNSFGEGRTLSELGYAGNFYGDTAAGIGATISGSIAEDDASDIQLQGVLFGGEIPDPE